MLLPVLTAITDVPETMGLFFIVTYFQNLRRAAVTSKMQDARCGAHGARPARVRPVEVRKDDWETVLIVFQNIH